MLKKIYQEFVRITHYLERICSLLEAIAAHEGAREVLYFCNGKRPGCSKEHCFKTGAGNCQYTDDIRYAQHFAERIKNKFREE